MAGSASATGATKRPTTFPGTLPIDEVFNYVIRDADGDPDNANLVVTVTQSDAGQIIMGTEYAIYFTISGDGESFGGLSNADEEEIFKFDGTSFSEYYNGGELGFGEEDIDALHVFQSGAFRFSIAGDNQTFNGVADGDNEDIFALDGPLDTTFTEVTFTPGDGSDTWGSNDINALYQYANGNLRHLVQRGNESARCDRDDLPAVRACPVQSDGTDIQRIRRWNVVVGRDRRGPRACRTAT